MDKENVELCAYHESGRVVYAYRQGYYCESIELSENDPGAGISKLNGGVNNETIQLILNNKTHTPSFVISNKAIEVAKKLMKIYCAGACAKIYKKNDKQISAQTEIDIPGQDMKYIDLIQSFLQQNVQGHPTDYPVQVITQIFHELKEEENWKVIEGLAKSALKPEDKKISRFYIEDALMKAGFKPLRQQNNSGIEMQLKEDDTPRPKTTATTDLQQTKEQQLLNDVLRKFLRTIKRELTEEEIDASVNYLTTVFKNLK